MLKLTREQILTFRRRVNGLDARAPARPAGFRAAAWAGLQDSMPRAAVLSLHARLDGVTADVLDDPSLVQVWGPRYGVYVTAAEDRAVFTLGRWPDTDKARERATLMASLLASHLEGDRRSYDEVGGALGINSNALRYGSTTGTVLIRWDGARAPLVWSVAPPEVSAVDARAELARRYLHIFGPGTAAGFAKWAGITDASGRTGFDAISSELIPVHGPLGDAWLLAADEDQMRLAPGAVAPARLLPSGDAHYLCWGADRGLLVPDSAEQAELWTSRVWPGAVLLDGELAGTWRRSQETVSVRLWRKPAPKQREALEAEAKGLPIPGCEGRIRVVWE